MNKYAPILVMAGAFLGAIGYSLLANSLDLAYRPFSDDTHAWIIYAFPTGAILSGVTVSAICSHFDEKYWAASIKCIVAGAIFAFCYINMYRSTQSLYSSTYALSESGPALIWSGLLLIYGLFLMQKALNRKT